MAAGRAARQPGLVVQRRVGHLLVPLVDLGVAQGRLAARAVRDHGVVGLEYVRLERPLEHLPLPLDELVGVRPVRAAVVHRHAQEPVRGDPPLVVLFHDPLALGDEPLDADALDYLVPAALDAELLLRLQLDGQALRVPAGVEHDAGPAHRGIPVPVVLDDAAAQVAHVRRAVHRRRPLDEHDGAPRPAARPARGGHLGVRVDAGHAAPDCILYPLGVELLGQSRHARPARRPQFRRGARRRRGGAGRVDIRGRGRTDRPAWRKGF